MNTCLSSGKGGGGVSGKAAAGGGGVLWGFEGSACVPFSYHCCAMKLLSTATE